MHADRGINGVAPKGGRITDDESQHSEKGCYAVTVLGFSRNRVDQHAPNK